jgi:hypothetical protein
MSTRRIVTAGLILLAIVACLAVAGIKGWGPLGHAHPAAHTTHSASGKASPSAPSNPSAAAVSSPAAQPSASPAAQAAAGSYTYSTPQPGSGCDKNGATWAEDNVQFGNGGCDVEATVTNQYGFLNVTLPGGRAFTQNNTVSITGSLGNSGDGYDAACLGLEENGSDGGYLAAYCNDGDWYVYTTSGEVVGHQLSTGSIPMGPNGTTYQMSLAMENGTLTLTFNNVNSPGAFKVADLSITPFQPAQVGIGYQYSGYQVPAPATDFVYTEQ